LTSGNEKSAERRWQFGFASARSAPLIRPIATLPPEPRWNQSPGEELANSISHGLGLIAGLIAAPFLILAALARENPAFTVGTSVFVATLLLLYLGSTLYHAWPQTPLKCALQVIDHSAIFLLIAGTYTPFTLGPLRGPWGWSILCLVWILAIGGVIMKITCGIGRPKVSVCLYLGMGWLILVALRPLALAVPTSTVVWLIAGGLAYTGGVLFFINEHVPYNHFVWHLFVLLGTVCHFCAVFSYAA